MNNFRPKTVDRTGAPAGSILRGVVPANWGLRIRVLHEQARGDGGPVTGGFMLLDAGQNRHSPALKELLNWRTDAAAVLAIIRGPHRMCVNVVNKNILQEEFPAKAVSVPAAAGSARPG